MKLPTPDKHLSAHPAIPPDPCLSLARMSHRVPRGDIPRIGPERYSAERYPRPLWGETFSLVGARYGGRGRLVFLRIAHMYLLLVPGLPFAWQDCAHSASSSG